MTANRIFVHESIHDEFVARFEAAMTKELKMGRGLEAGTTQGPIINQKQYDRVSYQSIQQKLGDTRPKSMGDTVCFLSYILCINKDLL